MWAITNTAILMECFSFLCSSCFCLISENFHVIVILLFSLLSKTKEKDVMDAADRLHCEFIYGLYLSYCVWASLLKVHTEIWQIKKYITEGLNLKHNYKDSKNSLSADLFIDCWIYWAISSWFEQFSQTQIVHCLNIRNQIIVKCQFE